MSEIIKIHELPDKRFEVVFKSGESRICTKKELDSLLTSNLMGDSLQGSELQPQSQVFLPFSANDLMEFKLSLDRTLSTIEHKHTYYQKVFQKYDNIINQLSEKINKISTAYDNINEKVNSLSDIVSDIHKKQIQIGSTLETHTNGMFAGTEEALQAIEVEIEDITISQDNIISSFNKMKNDIDNIQVKNRNNIEQLEHELSSVYGDMDIIANANNVRIEEKFDKLLSTEHEKLSNNISDLNNKFTDDIDNINKRLDSLTYLAERTDAFSISIEYLHHKLQYISDYIIELFHIQEENNRSVKHTEIIHSVEYPTQNNDIIAIKDVINNIINIINKQMDNSNVIADKYEKLMSRQKRKNKYLEKLAKNSQKIQKRALKLKRKHRKETYINMITKQAEHVMELIKDVYNNIEFAGDIINNNTEKNIIIRNQINITSTSLDKLFSTLTDIRLQQKNKTRLETLKQITRSQVTDIMERMENISDNANTIRRLLVTAKRTKRNRDRALRNYERGLEKGKITTSIKAKNTLKEYQIGKR